MKHGRMPIKAKTDRAKTKMANQKGEDKKSKAIRAKQYRAHANKGENTHWAKTKMAI